MGYQGFVVVALLFLFFPRHILGKERVNSFYSAIEHNISKELLFSLPIFRSVGFLWSQHCRRPNAPERISIRSPQC